MAFYDEFHVLPNYNSTGISIKGWFWQEGEPDDQPHKYEKSFATKDLEVAKEKLWEYANSQMTDPEEPDQPNIDEEGQMSLFP